MAKYQLILNIETGYELKFPDDAILLDKLEHLVMTELAGNVKFEPSSVKKKPEFCKNCEDWMCAGCTTCGPGDDCCWHTKEASHSCERHAGKKKST